MCSPARASSRALGGRIAGDAVSTKAITCARSARVSDPWPPMQPVLDRAAQSCAPHLPRTPSPSWWPRRRTSDPSQTSPSCWGRPSGRTSGNLVRRDSTSSSLRGHRRWTRSQTGTVTRRWPVVSIERGPATNRASQPPGAQPCTPTARDPMTSKSSPLNARRPQKLTRSLSRPQVSRRQPASPRRSPQDASKYHGSELPWLVPRLRPPRSPSADPFRHAWYNIDGQGRRRRDTDMGTLRTTCFSTSEPRACS